MLDLLLAIVREDGYMQHVQMPDSLDTPNDPAGETVCLEQMVPEYLLYGILKKRSAAQYYSLYYIVLLCRAPLKTLKWLVADRSGLARPFS